MIRYDSAKIKEIEYNLTNLHFFIREILMQQYQRITVEELPAETTLPSFHIFADEKDLESLEENLPASAKLQFKQSHIKIDKPPFSSEAKFRYRGGLDLHWFYKKKSIRVKLPPYTTYRGERQFSLVNPSTITTIIDLISYDMARSVGLLTPEYFPARVFINNKTNGLHFFLSRIDESFLRKNNRMPGSIYSGDTLYFINPYVKDIGKQEIGFTNDYGIPLLWEDFRLWEKDASRNAESSANREELMRFFEIIYASDPVVFMQSFDTYFNKEKFYLFWALDKIVGSYHHDFFHNHKIYFDPYKGKFEPIEWDMRFWTSDAYVPVTPLFKQILLNPMLKFRFDSAVHSLWLKFSVNEIANTIDEASNTLTSELAADPYRHHPDGNNLQFGSDKVVPFSMNEFSDAIKDLKQKYSIRHKIVEEELNKTEANYIIEKLSDDQTQITISISGNSAIDFDPWSTVSELSHDVDIYRTKDDKMHPVLNAEHSDILYPGIKIVKEQESDKLMPIMKMVYGTDSYPSSPLYYRYLIKGANSSDLLKSNELIAKNAITLKEVIINKVEELPTNDQTMSLHPWKLLSQNDPNSNDVTLSGVVNVVDDLIFSNKQTVSILPGTHFKLSKHSSVFFYGKVLAEGTAEAPIVFEPEKIGEHWGSIVIQGKEASGSQLNHIIVSGGSVAKKNMINYPGQLNIHDVDLFQLDYCHISNNSVGDDAVHIAYSQGRIQHCIFKNTAYDALDMDIVDVTVSDSEFIDIGNDAIDLMNSITEINDITVSGSGDKCISVGEASQVIIQNSRLSSCQMGIAVKDQSIAHLENIEFLINAGNAIALYRKNPRYSVGGEIHGDRLYGITDKDIVVGDYSVSNIKKSAYLPLDTHK